MRRLFRELLGTGNEPQTQKVPLSTRGHTIVEFGCDTCPNRNSVTIQSLGELSLDMDPTPPVAVSIGYVQKTTVPGAAEVTIRMPTRKILDLNTSPCDDPTQCPNAEAIESHAQSLRQHPEVLEAELDPPIQ